MPKIILPDVDAFSEEDRAFAVKQEDGTYALDVRPTNVVTQFRDNNILMKQREELSLGLLAKMGEQFGMEVKDLKDFNLDNALTGIGELKSIKAQVDDGKLVADTSLEEAIQRRTSELKVESEKRINELSGKIREKDTSISGLQKDMNDYILTQEVTMAVMNPDSGIIPEALPDVLNRSRSVFKVDGNKRLVAVDGEGRTVFGSDAVNPLSVTEWLKQTVEKSPHFSKTSQGGGASNERGGDASDIANTTDTGAFVAKRMSELTGGGRR